MVLMVHQVQLVEMELSSEVLVQVVRVEVVVVVVQLVLQVQQEVLVHLVQVEQADKMEHSLVVVVHRVHQV